MNRVTSSCRARSSRIAPVLCRSSKKLKNCCWGKDSDWAEDEGGNLFKSILMTQAMPERLQEQRLKFIDKCGRASGANDPVFFGVPTLEHVDTPDPSRP